MMSTDEKIARQLARKGKVDPSAGANAAWAAIAEANRIFGPHGWTREILDMRNAANRDRDGVMTSAYVARVRITVFGPNGPVIRDSHGCGEGRGQTPFEAHDHGLKAAELDATFRAFATFGRAFGLAGITEAKPAARRTSNDVRATGSATASSGEKAHQREPKTAPPADKTDQDEQDEPAGPDTLKDLRETQNAVLVPKLSRRRSPSHLAHVRAQPCLVCGRSPADAHHLRFVQPRAMGRKVSDEYTVPLCRRHHDLLHRDPNEADWWASLGIDPLAIADELWRESQGERPVKADRVPA